MRSAATWQSVSPYCTETQAAPTTEGAWGILKGNAVTRGSACFPLSRLLWVLSCLGKKVPPPAGAGTIDPVERVDKNEHPRKRHEHFPPIGLSPEFLFRHGFAVPPSPRGKVFGGSGLPTCGFYIVGGADSFILHFEFCILHFSLEKANWPGGSFPSRP